MVHEHQCRQCGACCEKGGPALHTRDLELTAQGRLSLDHLITIRKNELAFDPVKNSVEPVKEELVKVSGVNGTWACRFYNKTSHGCTVYKNRPQACRVLECWDTDAILALSGRDLVSRIDILADNPSLKKMVAEHEERYPCPDMEMISRKGPRSSRKVVSSFEAMITAELAHRSAAVKAHNMSVSLEMFCFGRPLFQLFQALGCQVRETPKGLKLKFNKPKGLRQQ
ncbi:MAG TPA: YkgJ family cysteine cluster protein [Desulfobacteraceae bacterium]|nr:YkgJ family cysteine cluster protein [Desulfobacteraceae bacterium]